MGSHGGRNLGGDDGIEALRIGAGRLLTRHLFYRASITKPASGDDRAARITAAHAEGKTVASAYVSPHIAAPKRKRLAGVTGEA